MNPSTFFFPSLTRLRSIAVILVLLAHSNLYGLLFSSTDVFKGTGKSAVWLFFCLSSVLLYSRLKSQFTNIKLSNNRSLITWLDQFLDVSFKYLRKRILRVFPLLWFYSFLLFVLNALFPFISPFIKIDSWFSLFSQLLLIDNPIGITWSLIIEFKFYLFLIPFAFLMSFFTRPFLRIIIIIFFIFICLSSSYPFTIFKNISLFPVLYIFLFGILTCEYIDILPVFFRNNFMQKSVLKNQIFNCSFFSILIFMFFISLVPSLFISLMKHILSFLSFPSVTSIDYNFLLAVFQPIQTLFWCLVIYLAVQKDYYYHFNTLNSPTTIQACSPITAFSVRDFFFNFSLKALDKYVFFPLASISYAVYLFHPPIYFIFSKIIVIASVDSMPLLVLIFCFSQIIVFSFSWLITNYFDKYFSIYYSTFSE